MNVNKNRKFTKKKIKRKSHNTRLSPLSFFPVSFRSKTISGHTPIMLLTTYVSPGREKSLVSIGLPRDCLDCTQSRCSAPLRRVTMNSVIEKGCSVPNKVKAVLLSSVWVNERQKSGSPVILACTRSQDTLCSSRQGCLTSQTWTPEISHCQWHKKFAQVWPGRSQHCHNNGRSRPQPHSKSFPSTTSSQTPKCETRILQPQGQTAYAPSATQ